MLKRGSNQYIYRHKVGLKPEVKRDCLVLIILMLLATLAGREYQHAHPILSPCPESGCISKVQAAEPKQMTTDEMVDFYANKYGKYPWEKLTIKVKLHYLLLRESAYGNSKNCGDGGLACGPLQFHESTYQSFRKIMMTKNLVKYIGSRFDLEDAIETTAWAISDGRENNWGPIARGEIKI